MDQQPGEHMLNQGHFISVDSTAELIGCSYPSVINLLKNKILKGKKNGKEWLVDAVDAQRVKDDKIVKPRPRGKNKEKAPVQTLETKPTMRVQGSLQPDEIEIRFTIKKEEFNLANYALATKNSSKGPKNLREYLEQQKDILLDKIRKQMAAINI